jgi:ferredoxin
MTNTIFYFTGTGNSLKVAKDIALGVENSSLISMATAMDSVSNLAPQGAVGFVFPVYYFGLPQIVREFVTAIDLSLVSYIYIACTYGKTLGNGGCVSQTKKILRGKGKTLNSAFYVKSVDNFILWTWDVPPIEKHAKLHETAKKKAEHIVKTVSNKENYCDRSFNEYTGPILFGYNRFIKSVRTNDKSFNYSEKCTSCGVCADVCPTDNIRFDDGHPIWKSETCQRCLACLHLCPTSCIQYGKITTKRQRYKNPYISVKELKRDNM